MMTPFILFSSSPTSSSSPKNQENLKFTFKKLQLVWREKSRQKLTNNDFTRKMKDLQKLPKNVGDLGKIIDATGFEKLPKLQ